MLRKKFSDVYVYFDGDVEHDEQLFQEQIKAFYLFNEVGKLSEFASKINENPKNKRWFFKNEA